MALTDYTTYTDIRASLGVSDDEIEDATLSLELYQTNLQNELEDISTDLPGDYATVKANSNRNAVEERLYRSVRQFSVYAIGKHLLGSLPLFSPKSLTDGKASMTRYSTDPYKETNKRIEAQYEKERTRLIDAYSKYNSSISASSATTMTYIIASTPSYDPVTGA